MAIIFKICSRQAWLSAVASGLYQGSEVDRADGFIHFSSPAQVRETAARHFRDQDDLVLVAVDTESLDARLKWEPSRNDQMFPHFYGPLPTGAAVAVYDLPLGDDGCHRFPDEVVGADA